MPTRFNNHLSVLLVTLLCHFVRHFLVFFFVLFFSSEAIKIRFLMILLVTFFC